MKTKKVIAKYLGYPLHDWVKGTRISKTKRFLLKSQFWSKEEMDAYQIKKLKLLIDHAIENVPYYQRVFKELSLSSSDINSIDDIKKLPLLTKEIVRREKENLTAKNISTMKIAEGKTGGTTGPSIKLYKDANARSFVWGAYHRWYNWIGIEEGDPIAKITGGSTTIFAVDKKSEFKQKIIDYLQNTISINCFEINHETYREIYKKINKHQPKFVRGYVTSVNQFINELAEHKLNGIHPDALSTTAETLLPHLREKFENFFHTKVYDQYGGGECESIAYECKNHEGLHITSEHCYLEILNGDNENVIDEVGKVVVTDLDNFAMPFIRYENGDLSSFNPNECGCGVKLPLLNSINGRATDTLKLSNGGIVLGGFFTDIFSRMDPSFTDTVRRFQATQQKVGQIIFKVESDETPDEKYLNEIRENCLKVFESVEVQVVKEIPLEISGKFRYIKSELK